MNGKYDKNTVLKSITNDIEEPVQQFLENQGFMANETYQKNDFADLMTSISNNISLFHVLCLFYDLCDENS